MIPIALALLALLGLGSLVAGIRALRAGPSRKGPTFGQSIAVFAACAALALVIGALLLIEAQD